MLGQSAERASPRGTVRINLRGFPDRADTEDEWEAICASNTATRFLLSPVSLYHDVLLMTLRPAKPVRVRCPQF